MLYSLSLNVIVDTIHALAAMEMLRVGEEAKALLSPLLDTERRGPLRLMIKNAFTEIVLALMAFVDDASLDSETASGSPGHQEADDDSDMLLQLSLRTPTKVNSTFHGLFRRKIELAVVYRVLETYALTASSSPEGCSAAKSSSLALAEAFGQKVLTARADLLSLLTPSFTPFIRPTD